MKWYSFEPADTLFFRGAQPMSMGIDHTASGNFPPPPQTITGALRTAVLKQNDISIDDYYSSTGIQEDILDVVGKAGEEANFCLLGPLFQIGKTVYMPAPYSWFIEKPQNGRGKAKVYKFERVNTYLLTASAGELYWVRGTESDLESMGGKWIPIDELQADKVSWKESSEFFVEEPRTGIALERNRKVRKHHIYSFIHGRLKKCVRILFGVTRDLPLENQGILKLGAEQRFGVYREIEPLEFDSGTSGYYVSLSVVEGNPSATRSLIATGKPKYIGGWDLKKGFHKPMKGYYPAGSVFKQKLNENFIEL